MAEVDNKYRQQYKDLRKRIREIEEENDVLNVKLFKARKNIRHLKLERTFLLDRMEKANQPPPSLESDNSDIGSEIYSHDESEMVAHKHKSKPQRKKKDPNAPKGPGNVFFLFCRLERDKIKIENPTESIGEVTRLLGHKWKSLTTQEKQKYYDMYKRELEEYEVAMKSYTNGVPTINVTAEDISSPTQSTEDFSSGPAEQRESPYLGSPIENTLAQPVDSTFSNSWQSTVV